MKYVYLLLLAIAITSCGNDKRKSTLGSNNVETTPTTPLEKSVKRGEDIFGELCVTCHMPTGKGVPGAFPPLNPSDWLTNKRIASIHAVKYGLKGEITVNGAAYNSVMLPLGLDDKEVADVMNYAIQTWNTGDMVTEEEVKAVEK
ncbi:MULTISPECIES: c-type cytochrome [unclassified Nonlabens]|uniref:c-type cytochrome n=1 Tax=unclassified Nonlabens TaxID=2615035 RepID=UPI00386EFC28